MLFLSTKSGAARWGLCSAVWGRGNFRGRDFSADAKAITVPFRSSARASASVQSLLGQETPDPSTCVKVALRHTANVPGSEPALPLPLRRCTYTEKARTREDPARSWHTPRLFVGLGPLSKGNPREPIFLSLPLIPWLAHPSGRFDALGADRARRCRLQQAHGTQGHAEVLSRLRGCRVQGSRRRVPHMRRGQDHLGDAASRRVCHRADQGG